MPGPAVAGFNSPRVGCRHFQILFSPSSGPFFRGPKAGQGVEAKARPECNPPFPRALSKPDRGPSSKRSPERPAPPPSIMSRKLVKPPPFLSCLAIVLPFRLCPVLRGVSSKRICRPSRAMPFPIREFAPSVERDHAPGPCERPIPGASAMSGYAVSRAGGACDTCDNRDTGRAVFGRWALRHLRHLRHGRHRRGVCRSCRRCRNGGGPDFGKRRVRVKPHRRPPG